MARKETITREFLFEAAFQMLREEGMENITARKLAVKAGCSTQPIFRLYSNMDELWQALFERAIEYFEEYHNCAQSYAAVPFVNLGMSYIRFAAEEKHLFQMLFLSEQKYGKSFYEILDGSMQTVEKEIDKAKSDGCKNPEELFRNMWTFIHGSACMIITGDYRTEPEETVSLLKTVYNSFAF